MRARPHAGSRLLNKVCVVNGAASTIGQAVAQRFISDGAVVVRVDTAEDSVGQHAVQADHRGDGSALDISLETWRVQDANLTSIFLACKHGIPHLRATDPAGGSVINAASFLAAVGAATAPMA